MRPVIYDFARAGYGSGLKEIDAEPVSSLDAVFRADPVTVQIADAACCDIVLGKSRDEFRLDAEIGERYCHVGLASAECGREFPCL